MSEHPATKCDRGYAKGKCSWPACACGVERNQWPPAKAPAGVAVGASALQREAIIRAAVAAMPNCNPGVADDLIEGHAMHMEADDLVAVWQAAAGVLPDDVAPCRDAQQENDRG